MSFFEVFFIFSGILALYCVVCSIIGLFFECFLCFSGFLPQISLFYPKSPGVPQNCPKNRKKCPFCMVGKMALYLRIVTFDGFSKMAFLAKTCLFVILCFGMCHFKWYFFTLVTMFFVFFGNHQKWRFFTFFSQKGQNRENRKGYPLGFLQKRVFLRPSGSSRFGW